MHAIGVSSLHHALGQQTDVMVTVRAPITEATGSHVYAHTPRPRFASLK